MTVRSLLEHVGVDTYGRDIRVGSRVTDPWEDEPVHGDWMLFTGGALTGAGGALLIVAAVVHWWERRQR